MATATAHHGHNHFSSKSLFLILNHDPPPLVDDFSKQTSYLPTPTDHPASSSSSLSSSSSSAYDSKHSDFYFTHTPPSSTFSSPTFTFAGTHSPSASIPLEPMSQDASINKRTPSRQITIDDIINREIPFQRTGRPVYREIHSDHIVSTHIPPHRRTTAYAPVEGNRVAVAAAAAMVRDRDRDRLVDRLVAGAQNALRDEEKIQAQAAAEQAAEDVAEDAADEASQSEGVEATDTEVSSRYDTPEAVTLVPSSRFFAINHPPRDAHVVRDGSSSPASAGPAPAASEDASQYAESERAVEEEQPQTEAEPSSSSSSSDDIESDDGRVLSAAQRRAEAEIKLGRVADTLHDVAHIKEIVRITSHISDRHNYLVYFHVDLADGTPHTVSERELQTEKCDLVYRYWDAHGGRDGATELEFYHVFELLKKREGPREPSYLVQWVGYRKSPGNTTWERRSHLQDISPDVLAAFEKQQSEKGRGAKKPKTVGGGTSRKRGVAKVIKGRAQKRSKTA